MTGGRLVYVWAPGTGKSTLMSWLTAGLTRVPCRDAGVFRDELFRHGQLVGVELGRKRDLYSGTDALALNAHPLACAWLRLAAGYVPTVYGEGQRLATQAFLQTAVDVGRRVDLIWLDPPAHVAQARRDARRSNQDDRWLKGATTRAANLGAQAASWPGVRLHQVTDVVPARTLARHVMSLLGQTEPLEVSP